MRMTKIKILLKILKVIGFRKKSWVWNHLMKERKCDGSIAMCKYCIKVLSDSTKEGTSHLKYYLENIYKKY